MPKLQNKRYFSERIIRRRLFIVEKIWNRAHYKTREIIPREVLEPNRLKKSNLNCNSPYCHPKTRIIGLPIRDKRRIPADIE